MRVVFTTVAARTFSPPKAKSLLTFGAYTAEAAPLFRSATAARGVHVLATGSNRPNSLILSPTEKE
jgi:hypothetical protein